MKFSFLFLLVSVVLAALVFVVFSVAALTELKEILLRKTGSGDLSVD
jgi:hypothetical protein